MFVWDPITDHPCVTGAVFTVRISLFISGAKSGIEITPRLARRAHSLGRLVRGHAPRYLQGAVADDITVANNAGAFDRDPLHGVRRRDDDRRRHASRRTRIERHRPSHRDDRTTLSSDE